jgi:predicted TIM-barrel fold metal-dependent hydrolase
MIWDLHCHLAKFPGKTPDERMAKLVEYATRMGIDRVCLYLGLAVSQNPSPERMRSDNDEALQALAHYHDRAFGFVYLTAEHVDASLAEIERCVKNGPMVGIKLWIAVSCRDEKIDPIIRRAAELKAVIYQHTWMKTDGNTPGESTPADLVALARRHPQTPIICGHTGGNWELGIRTVRAQKNVYVDLAGSDPTQGITEMAVRELGAERVIYGSDVGGRSYASQLAKVQGANIPDAEKRLILGENLKRLLTPILEAKGIKA